MELSSYRNLAVWIFCHNASTKGFRGVFKLYKTFFFSSSKQCHPSRDQIDNLEHIEIKSELFYIQFSAALPFVFVGYASCCFPLLSYVLKARVFFPGD